jgi:hypothetical protein
MGRKKKIDIATASQINGALEDKSGVFDYMKKKEFPYQEQTLAEYRAKLNSLNISDLQRHAIEIANILPNITDRSRLADKLEREYLRRQGLFMIRYSSTSIPSSGLTAKQEDAIKKIINR